MANDVCKFHGKFSDLIPAGFKFHKAFARNYRVYTLEKDHTQYVNIWQHHGGYVEVLDMTTIATKNLYSLIKQNGIEQFKYEFHSIVGGGFCYRWIVNNKNQDVELYDRECHNDMHAHFSMEDMEYDENYIRLVVSHILDSYRTVLCSPEQMDAILIMIDKGFVIP